MGDTPAAGSVPQPLGEGIPCRESYREAVEIRPFYSGGPVAVCPALGWIFSLFETKLCVVSLTTGSLVKSIELDGEMLTAVAVSSLTDEVKTFRLAVASRTLHIHIISLPSLEVERTIRAHKAPILSLAFHPDAPDVLASGSADNAVRVFDVDGGYCSHAFRDHSNIVTDVSFFHTRQDTQGVVLASAGMDGGYVHDLVDKKTFAKMQSHVGRVNSLTHLYHNDTPYMVSGGSDGLVTIWRHEERQRKKGTERVLMPVGTLPVMEAVSTVGVVGTQDGSLEIVIGCQGGEVQRIGVEALLNSTEESPSMIVPYPKMSMSKACARPKHLSRGTEDS
ncbi:hypothetical protein KIPB_009866, partial [Kipferlia bialata]|eukprot:g9866.t1